MANLISDMEAALSSAANSENAAGMARYMKDHFPYYGIKSPERKKLQRPFVNAAVTLPPAEFKDWALACWAKDQREWQYIAIDALTRYVRKMDESFIGLNEKLILNKSWWDSVDFLSGTILGGLLKKLPEQQDEIIQRYIRADDMWLNRSAILFQLKYKEAVDLKLLSELINVKKTDNRFFIQKAIGWALRSASKQYPDEVREVLAAHSELSNLAKREASKYL